jgi:CheY-like chemotaxis protein
MIASMKSRVLVVDDDAVFRRLAARIIGTDEGVSIHEAETVASALEIARAVKPGAALVDVGLPDGDGIALARDLTALPWRPVVVLTSSDPDAVTAADVRSSGVRAFVPKDELPSAPLARLLALA